VAMGITTRAEDNVGFDRQPLDRLMQMKDPSQVNAAVKNLILRLNFKWAEVPENYKNIFGVRGAEIESDIHRFLVLADSGNLPNDVLNSLGSDFESVGRF